MLGRDQELFLTREDQGKVLLTTAPPSPATLSAFHGKVLESQYLVPLIQREKETQCKDAEPFWAQFHQLGRS